MSTNVNLKTRKKYQNNYADYDKQRSLTVNRTIGLLNLAICGKEIKNTTRKIVYKVAKYVYKYILSQNKNRPKKTRKRKTRNKRKDFKMYE